MKEKYDNKGRIRQSEKGMKQEELKIYIQELQERKSSGGGNWNWDENQKILKFSKKQM